MSSPFESDRKEGKRNSQFFRFTRLILNFISGLFHDKGYLKFAAVVAGG